MPPGFANGAAEDAGGNGNDLEYDPVGLGELAGMNGGAGRFFWGGEGREVGAAAGEECGERDRERGGCGSYHRLVFGGEGGFVDRLSSGWIVL